MAAFIEDDGSGGAGVTPGDDGAGQSSSSGSSTTSGGGSDKYNAEDLMPTDVVFPDEFLNLITQVSDLEREKFFYEEQYDIYIEKHKTQKVILFYATIQRIKYNGIYPYADLGIQCYQAYGGNPSAEGIAGVIDGIITDSPSRMAKEHLRNSRNELVRIKNEEKTLSSQIDRTQQSINNINRKINRKYGEFVVPYYFYQQKENPCGIVTWD